MTTLEDIAKALGTSKGTVSKALHGASDVSETTRKAVIEKAVELGYTKLVSKNKGKLCVMVENMAVDAPGDFGYDIINGFQKAAVPAGYQVDLISLNDVTQASVSFDSYMLNNNYWGAFILGLSYSDIWSNHLHTCHTPMVLLDCMVRENPMISSVGTDTEEGMMIAVAHLKALGHRKIGYLSGALGSYIFQQRYLAFFHALKQHHLAAERSQARHTYYTSDLLQNDLPYLVNQGCTAIICSHDALAYAVLTRCRENGIAVPGDVSIVGIDDLPYSEHCYPSLTTIRQNLAGIGKSAFYAMSCRFEGIPVSNLQLHAELKIRNSTGPASKK